MCDNRFVCIVLKLIFYWCEKLMDIKKSLKWYNVIDWVIVVLSFWYLLVIGVNNKNIMLIVIK